MPDDSLMLEHHEYDPSRLRDMEVAKVLGWTHVRIGDDGGKYGIRPGDPFRYPHNIIPTYSTNNGVALDALESRFHVYSVDKRHDNSYWVTVGTTRGRIRGEGTTMALATCNAILAATKDGDA